MDSGDDVAGREAAAQGKRFKRAARKLGCDGSEERFEKALRTIARQKPTEPPKPVKRSKAKRG